MTPYEALLEANGDAQVRMGKADAADPWAGSPFEWLMRLPSRSRGRAGELIVEAWLEGLGFEVRLPSNSGHDRTVNRRKVEIKFSTLWASREYVFQQLRDQDTNSSCSSASARRRRTHGRSRSAKPSPRRYLSMAVPWAGIRSGCVFALMRRRDGWRLSEAT